MKNKILLGHLLALFTIIVWGTTFISTKVLLDDFQPLEILFIRFIMGLIALFVLCPSSLRSQRENLRTQTDSVLKQEFMFALAGLFGVCVYYLFENVALSYTFASHVGVIVSMAPLFTAIFAHFLTSDEKLKPSFFVGFVIAMLGIGLISFTGTDSELELNSLFGDFLAVIAPIAWGCYSMCIKRISTYGYNTILITRRIFYYGILFMLPALLLFDVNFTRAVTLLARPELLLNMSFLGFVASALCFITWNKAVEILGAITTSIYIYVGPAVTVVVSAMVLHENITLMSGVGTLLTIAGLLLSR